MSSEMKRTLCNEPLAKGLVSEGDVIRHSYTRNRLDNGVENMSRTERKEKLSPTLDTRCDCLGAVVKEPTKLQKEVCNQAIEKEMMKPYDIIDYTYSNARLDEIKNGKIKTKNSTDNQISNTITTNAENMGVCVPNTVKPICLNSKGGRGGVEGLQPSVQDRVYDSQGISTAVTTSFMPSYTSADGLRIRKLTPKECWRLMGFDDEDVEKAAQVCSNSQLYKQAGNSIVVNVLEAIFKELFVAKKTRSEWLDELLS